MLPRSGGAAAAGVRPRGMETAPRAGRVRSRPRRCVRPGRSITYRGIASGIRGRLSRLRRGHDQLRSRSWIMARRLVLAARDPAPDRGRPHGADADAHRSGRAQPSRRRRDRPRAPYRGRRPGARLGGPPGRRSGRTQLCGNGDRGGGRPDAGPHRPSVLPGRGGTRGRQGSRRPDTVRDGYGHTSRGGGQRRSGADAAGRARGAGHYGSRRCRVGEGEVGRHADRHPRAADPADRRLRDRRRAHLCGVHRSRARRSRSRRGARPRRARVAIPRARRGARSDDHAAARPRRSPPGERSGRSGSAKLARPIRRRWPWLPTAWTGRTGARNSTRRPWRRHGRARWRGAV